MTRKNQKSRCAGRLRLQGASLAIGYEIRLRRERWMFEPYFTIKNAFDEIYIPSRAPQGRRTMAINH